MITFLMILISIQSIECIIYMNVNFKNKTETDMYHMYVKIVCQSRKDICKVSHKNVCAVRKIKETMEYKDFENSCQVFMHNFCDSPGQEYYIVTSGKCETYLQTRRHEESPTENPENADLSNKEGNDEVTEGNDETNSITEGNDDTQSITEESITDIVNSTKPILRNKASQTKTTKFVPLYEVDTAFDDHICPLSCPDTYSPVCVSANRGNGMYFKFYTFVNHCSGDLYYCKNPDEFAPAPDESAEDVNSSKLGWSYCGASRYLQFARFSEAVSSLGYYGWLSGDQKYSHIMEPYERKPGYG